MDNNGVPRFHLAGTSRHFRAFSDGPTIDGRQVQYSLTEGDGHRLYDKSFRHIRTVNTSGWDAHDFLITEDDTLLFLGYKSATRDASHITASRAGSIVRGMYGTKEGRSDILARGRIRSVLRHRGSR